MHFGIRSLILAASLLGAFQAIAADSNTPAVSTSAYRYLDPYTGIQTTFPKLYQGERKNIKMLLNVQGRLTLTDDKSATQRHIPQAVGVLYPVQSDSAWILRHARGAQEISQEITQLFAKQGTCVSVKMNKKDKYQHLSKAPAFIVLSCAVNNEPTKIATALIQSPIRGTYQVMVMAESAQNAEKILDQMLLKTQIQADQAAADDIASNFATVESTEYQQGMLGEVGSEGDQE